MGIWNPGPGPTSGGDSFTGDATNETADGGVGDDGLEGNGGDDVLHGGDNNDFLDGGADRDELFGDAGDDTLLIRASQAAANEVLNGGSGADTLVAVIYEEDTPSTIDFADMTVSSIETVEFYGDALQSILLFRADQIGAGLSTSLAVVGTSAPLQKAIYIVASAATTLNLSGWTFTDWGPADYVQFQGSTLIDNFTGTSRNDAIYGGNGNDVLIGGDGDDGLYGGANIDTLTGGAGADYLDGEGGADTMTGGAGDDIYVIDNAGDILGAEAGGGGIDTVRTLLSHTLAAQYENLVLLGLGGTSATGNGLNNTLTGNSGWNILNGGFGADAMSGGLGNDTYYVDNVGDTVTETGVGVDTVNSTVSFTLGANVENLSFGGSANIDGTGNELDNKIIGNSGHNHLIGNGGADILFGNEGADALSGEEGQDRMYGGLGDDTYYVNQTNDQAFENADEGYDVVYSGAANYTISAGIEALYLTSDAGAGKAIGNALNNNIGGNAFNNILFGKDGNDSLSGNGGEDTMYGGAGNDHYYVDSAGDIVFENAGEGVDEVQSSITYTLRANVEDLTLLYAEGSVEGTGNGLNNAIFGSTHDDTLRGLGGDDRINGYSGDDFLIGGAGDDDFWFYQSMGNDTIEDFVAGGSEDTLDFNLFNGSGITWEITQVGADTLFSFSNGATLTLLNVDHTELVELTPFYYS